MGAILMFHNCVGQSHKTVSTEHNFSSERRAEADSNRGLSAYQPNALPLGQTGSQIIAGVSFVTAQVAYVSTNKNRFHRDGPLFLPGADAPHAYVRAWKQ